MKVPHPDWPIREKKTILDAYRQYTNSFPSDDPKLWKQLEAVRVVMQHWDWNVAAQITGFGNSTLRREFPKWIRDLHNALFGNWVGFKSDWVNSPSNNMDPFYPPNCIGSVDTFPIFIHRKWSSTYQPKYAAKVVKPMVVTLHTGFIAFVSPPARGACNDGEILEQSDVMEILQENDWMILADGGFKSSRRVLIPFSSSQIQPKRLKPGQTLEEYRERADHCRRLNAKLAHFRARVEHCFGNGKYGEYFKRDFSLKAKSAERTLNLAVRLVAP